MDALHLPPAANQARPLPALVAGGVIDETLLRRLAAGLQRQGEALQLQRMHFDRRYALERVALAHCSPDASVRRLAMQWFDLCLAPATGYRQSAIVESATQWSLAMALPANLHCSSRPTVARRSARVPIAKATALRRARCSRAAPRGRAARAATPTGAPGSPTGHPACATPWHGPCRVS